MQADTSTTNLNDSQLIFALSSKKEAINNEITELKSKIQSLTSGLVHIEATINLLSGVSSPIKIQRQAKSYLFKPHGCKTNILDCLRNATKPVDTKEITLFVLKSHGIDVESINFSKSQKIILMTLRALEKKSLVSQVGREGLLMLWSIANR